MKKRNEWFLFKGVKQEWKCGNSKRIIKIGYNLVLGHSSRCAKFDNGKLTNPICGMAKERSPHFIMAKLSFSRFLAYSSRT
jgi:hypothetical protein